MVSPKSFVLHPALYIQSRAPKADWVFSCPASHKAVSLSNSAPRPRTELLQLPSISRGAVDLQGHTEPGRIRADSCDCHTHTHTHSSRAPRSCNSAQLVQERAKQEKDLPVETAVSTAGPRAASALLLYCRWCSQGLPTVRTHPQASHKINRVSGDCVSTPHIPAQNLFPLRWKKLVKETHWTQS